jgi:hypothetical protein
MKREKVLNIHVYGICKNTRESLVPEKSIYKKPYDLTLEEGE